MKVVSGIPYDVHYEPYVRHSAGTEYGTEPTHIPVIDVIKKASK